MKFDKQRIRIIIIAALVLSACSPPAKYRFVCTRGSEATFSAVVYSVHKRQTGLYTIWQLGLFPSGSVNYQEHPDESCRRMLLDSR